MKEILKKADGVAFLTVGRAGVSLCVCVRSDVSRHQSSTLSQSNIHIHTYTQTVRPHWDLGHRRRDDQRWRGTLVRPGGCGHCWFWVSVYVCVCWYVTSAKGTTINNPSSPSPFFLLMANLSPSYSHAHIHTHAHTHPETASASKPAEKLQTPSSSSRQTMPPTHSEGTINWCWVSLGVSLLALLDVLAPGNITTAWGRRWRKYTYTYIHAYTHR
jgi:hypothetical protein